MAKIAIVRLLNCMPEPLRVTYLCRHLRKKTGQAPVLVHRWLRRPLVFQEARPCGVRSGQTWSRFAGCQSYASSLGTSPSATGSQTECSPRDGISTATDNTWHRHCTQHSAHTQTGHQCNHPFIFGMHHWKLQVCVRIFASRILADFQNLFTSIFCKKFVNKVVTKYAATT